MNISPDSPKRPALRYYGGKWVLANWIISFFPPHKIYVEPCGGAASVLLKKPRSRLEIYNDLESNVFNFFRVLRDRPDELISRISLTPWSRDELKFCHQPTDDPIESARRFYFISQASISASQRKSSGMRMVYRLDSGVPAVENAVTTHLRDIAGRLLGVQFENKDALYLIPRADTPETLIYFDPPYLKEVRTNGHEYSVDQDIDFHVASANLLKDCAGYVVISGYATPLYKELYESCGWKRFDRKTMVNSNRSRIESVWLSPKTAKAFESSSR